MICENWSLNKPLYLNFNIQYYDGENDRNLYNAITIRVVTAGILQVSQKGVKEHCCVLSPKIPSVKSYLGTI